VCGLPARCLARVSSCALTAMRSGAKTRVLRDQHLVCLTASGPVECGGRGLIEDERVHRVSRPSSQTGSTSPGLAPTLKRRGRSSVARRPGGCAVGDDSASAWARYLPEAVR
jgi:hypothetical protein